jgi:ATP adenylyltransferase
VLNKFPVIPDHFILATKEFKKQTDLLEEEDLAAAYDCLKAYKEEGEELFAFFNSGEHSGASQPHRHIQFLPVESMRSGIEPGSKWDVLPDSLVRSPQPDLPFSYFAATIPSDPTGKQLREIYLDLYEKACQVSGVHVTKPGTADSLISYNLGLTDKAIVLCPRTSEGTKIEGSQGELIGPISLNGTVLGGTFLVKTEIEWNALKSDESRLMGILKSIGIPSGQISHEGRL